ncbi:MAG: hypothetical protein AMXMBFR13_47790 [Phycisphaerae bacterium]|jgi:hypothetical protein
MRLLAGAIIVLAGAVALAGGAIGGLFASRPSPNGLAVVATLAGAAMGVIGLVIVLGGLPVGDVPISRSKPADIGP